ncbi:Microsomal glutathione S-transferase 3 [Podochytrium sp. JEL0797]|nr:Microsomal glutathione S-transferase 3 [Podochytrium sp. JEL0797]
MIDTVASAILTSTPQSLRDVNQVVELTGPFQWTHVIRTFLATRGCDLDSVVKGESVLYGEVCGGVLVLPPVAMNPGEFEPNVTRRDERTVVYHEFMGNQGKPFSGFQTSKKAFQIELAKMSIMIPNEYGYVIAVGALSTLYPVILGGQVGGARKRAGVPYPHMYATQAECKEDKKKYLFNCFQRAHQNLLENYPQFLFLLATAGINHPIAASGAGIVWLVGRVLYASNYQTGDPAKRNSGVAWIHYLGLLALMGMSLTDGVRMSLLAFAASK